MSHPQSPIKIYNTLFQNYYSVLKFLKITYFWLIFVKCPILVTARSKAARLLGLWVRIPPWRFVYCLLCIVR